MGSEGRAIHRAFRGNRNAYDYAYTLTGEVFLFDSDMEWDINMPWYREVRTVHGVPGTNFGYRDGSGKYPAYYLDSLPPVREVGRGSPVGVEFYTSYAYPREFFDNFFEADWSRGRLLYTALTPNGATYSARADRAEFVHGEPFNITDVEVAPDGMLYSRRAAGTPQAGSGGCATRAPFRRRRTRPASSRSSGSRNPFRAGAGRPSRRRRPQWVRRSPRSWSVSRAMVLRRARIACGLSTKCSVTALRRVGNS